AARAGAAGSGVQRGIRRALPAAPGSLRRPAADVPANRLVSPPVAPALDVVALVDAGRRDDQDLESVRPGLVAPPGAGRDAHGVPCAELDDLLVALNPAAPAYDDVHLLLLPVRVAVCEAVPGRDALVAQ